MNVCKQTYMYAYACVHVCLLQRLFMCMFVSMHACKYGFQYLCVYACMHVSKNIIQKTKKNVRGTLVQSASVQHSPANYNRPPSKLNLDNLPAHIASRTPQQSLAPHHEASTRGDRCLTLCTDTWGAADSRVGCELVAGVAILPLDFCCACDVFACIHMYACVCVCVYVYMHTHTHMYVRT